MLQQKRGIWSATRVAAKENSEHDILINMIIPGTYEYKHMGKRYASLTKSGSHFSYSKAIGKP